MGRSKETLSGVGNHPDRVGYQDHEGMPFDRLLIQLSSWLVIMLVHIS